MLQWNQQFLTGNAKIDHQHRTLIAYINRLEEIASCTNFNRQELEFILSLVDFMEGYIHMHFEHEENCMRRHQCPAYDENKEAHGIFREFFKDFKRRFQAEGCRPHVLKELHDRCCSWIENHIMQTDVKLKPYLAAGTPEAEME